MLAFSLIRLQTMALGILLSLPLHMNLKKNRKKVRHNLFVTLPILIYIRRERAFFSSTYQELIHKFWSGDDVYNDMSGCLSIAKVRSSSPKNNILSLCNWAFSPFGTHVMFLYKVFIVLVSTVLVLITISTVFFCSFESCWPALLAHSLSFGNLWLRHIINGSTHAPGKSSVFLGSG